MIRVVVVDDQAMVREGFGALLDRQPDMAVVGAAGDGEHAVALCRREKPDVVLMDIRLPVVDGLAATRALMGDPDPPKVLVLTTFDLDEYVYEALRSGACGFLLKDARAEELITAVRVVAEGHALLAPRVTGRLIERFAQQAPAPSARPRELSGLTPRETEVLRQVAKGLSNAEVADRLSIAEETVKTHVGRILGKLGLRDRVQAVVLAYETGLARGR
ncbi:response regulator [Saccharothrix algeriensis]|uniref:DNA-binding NarL/FixJ family response regulator n=1 Tax=Saccharothrix algeriensis TaxID=173560 RepID=A0A8T8HYE9_9PSEU|nr:response regulator transcription factor [Saccharothrix algeriensis]MBM7814990.1 DNA-binding NarL/FixJ family response regulator [Saccharothrix algeriensis]QTR03250.1 response regulator transcription factor [Saccharothrix algeriensis]